MIPWGTPTRRRADPKSAARPVASAVGLLVTRMIRRCWGGGGGCNAPSLALEQKVKLASILEVILAATATASSHRYLEALVDELDISETR